MHSWSVGDPDFVGAVTILDEEGARLATVEWPAADGSGGRPVPEQARVAPGWVVGGDWLGRRVTSVNNAGAAQAIPRIG